MIKDFIEARDYIQQLYKKYDTIRISNDFKSFKKISNVFEKPSEISMSLVRKTHSDFKGMGDCESDHIAFLKWDEYSLQSKETIESINFTKYITALLKDYKHLEDCIDGYIYYLKRQKSCNWKNFWKECFKSIVPWILATLPYVIKIIEIFANK